MKLRIGIGLLFFLVGSSSSTPTKRIEKNNNNMINKGLGLDSSSSWLVG